MTERSAPPAAASGPPYRVLVTDDVDPEGVELLRAERALVVDEVPTLPAAELLERIADYDAIIGRSATRISAELLKRGTRLKVVGRAGVGVDNVAMEAATALGVAVINAPAGNTVAVAELVFGTLISLIRHLPHAAESMRAGRWDRSKLLGSELKGRTLGIVGLGRIGGEVASRAHAFCMPLVGYDPYVADARFATLRVRRATSLEELLDEADVVTVHTPLNDETTGMIGRRELARMRGGSIVANLARGGIVDETALVDALVSGQIGGATVDAYTVEPLPKDHPLRTAPNVVLTPHIGASTAEAQRNVAVDVCVAVRDALLTGELSRSMNVATISTPWNELAPALLVARRAAAVARAMLADQGIRTVQHVAVRCGSDVAGAREAILASAALGLLEAVVESERLNLINARALAEARGVELSVGESAQLAPSAVEVSLRGGISELAVAGVAPVGSTPRLTRIGGFHVDVNPRQTLIVLTNRDVPGVIGRVGTALGDAGVNIAEYHQARLAQGGEALAVVSVDNGADVALRRRLLEIPDVRSATVVTFRGE
ncbi:MAG TPA: phosphoglycerate dehydrogenase [Gemmatimonadaceae bacterium]|nr:phosphoglycerate dehydrogenase [Gemmatimonadaceae bacterium]